MVVVVRITIRNRPFAWFSSLGPSPGLGRNRSTTARVGSNAIAPAKPSKPADIPVASTGALALLPKSTTSR
ncbi:MAG: hypothetical protein BWY91_03367 [bacterium ADurb.BinA028]|nr:MAG: hypothetical protein BWY91_03367 [bacterium ADurb.BinA028]